MAISSEMGTDGPAPMSHYLVSLFLVLSATSCDGGRILVFPEDGSHWINMEVILRELHSRGHSLTVLRSSRSWYIQENPDLYTLITVTPQDAGGDAGHDFGPDFFSLLMRRSLELRSMFPLRRFLEQQKDVAMLLRVLHGVALNMISTILQDAELVDRLRYSAFDLVLTDPAFPVGVLLARYLNLPMVYNVRWLNVGEVHMAVAPSPPSYVPVYNSLFHDTMTFLQRTENFLRYAASLLQERFVILPVYKDLLRQHFPPGADLISMQRSADILLVRVNFVFELPRPTMPNVVYIGGFQCTKAKPLPAELEAFVQSSGEHGVVVMSLGTLVTALPQEVTEAIAAGFARLPQKVVWRYVGEPPSSLGNNTLLMSWLPQNDLLGHPRTRAFVSHGGTNGIYEAIYHGVPILGLPLLFDQFDNFVRLRLRGAARVIDATSLTAESFLAALKDVLETPSYRENMQRLSRLHHDQPMSPMDTAMFWIEYVIRNKGAGHLCSAGTHLPWYSYHCLDVIAFLASLAVAFLCASATVCRFLCCCQRTKRKMKPE